MEILLLYVEHQASSVGVAFSVCRKINKLRRNVLDILPMPEISEEVIFDSSIFAWLWEVLEDSEIGVLSFFESISFLFWELNQN